MDTDGQLIPEKIAAYQKANKEVSNSQDLILYLWLFCYLNEKQRHFANECTFAGCYFV